MLTDRLKNAEQNQALLRLIVAAVAGTYILVTAMFSTMPRDNSLMLASFIAGFMLVSAGLLLHVIRRPGVFPWRRILGMAFDYGGISFTMILGGEHLLPIYVVLLWVTVGNGMRYGSRYLAVSTTLGLSALATIFYYTPYWHAHPYVIVTVVLTTVIVPAYAQVLLSQTRKAYEKADAANLARSRFLAQASHDLRQPIHSISLFTACLRDANLGDEARRMVDNIDKSVHSLSQLFRSILDSYTLDNGRVVPRSEVVQIKSLIDAMALQNSEVARWAGVTLRVRASRHQVRVDPNFLNTMLQNLVSNAIKYGAGGSVLIGCRVRNGTLSIEVHDQGRGISNQHLPHVFDEFYRVRQVRDKDIEGVGLGLSIVQRIGALMGLQVRLASRPGVGTVACIDGITIETGQPQPKVAAPASSGRPLSGLRVLLIEDDRNVLLATATLLQKWGCQVQTATTIPDGDVQCDLVISDFDLNTEASGADCIAYMRQLSGSNIPAMLITGHDKQRVEDAVGDPTIPVLSKPVRPAELRSMLTALKAGILSHAQPG
ncbi:MAG: hybrid sensor histidine kinase/response regulator [Burkholderiaceae bacterium]